MFITKDYLKEKYTKEPVVEYPNEVKSQVKKPKVTVFMCAYNHESFIKDALNGILSQKTDFDFEFLISEDESSDGTREICKRYAKKFPDKIRLFLHKRENNIKILGKPCGIFPHVYNLLQSRGEYVAVCAGDDYWTDENKLQKQYNYLISHPECSVVYQRWQEKTINVDGSYSISSNTSLKSPKASTSMFLNFNDRLPTQMLKVIQEDTFRWFILKSEGGFHCMEGLKPIIVNTPAQSLTHSLSDINFFKQALNLKKNIYQAYKNTPRAVEAKSQYVRIFYGIIKQERYKGLRLRCFFLSFVSAAKDRLLFFTIRRLITGLKKKWIS